MSKHQLARLQKRLKKDRKDIQKLVEKNRDLLSSSAEYPKTTNYTPGSGHYYAPGTQKTQRGIKKSKEEDPQIVSERLKKA